MVPYYLFGLISIAIFAVLGRFAAGKLGMSIDTSPIKSILGLLYATDVNSALKFNVPLWFLPCLFATKLLYYVLCKFFRSKTPYIILCSTILCIVGFIYSACSLPALPFTLAVALKMLLFFTMGRVFFQHVQSCKSKLQNRLFVTGLGVLLLAVSCIIGYIAPNVNYASDYFPNALTFLITASLGCLAVCLLSIGISHNKALEHIGQNTLGILVMHKFPILVFQTIGPLQTILAQHNTFMGNAVGGISVCVITITLCLIATIIINKLFPFMLGNCYSKKAK